MSGDEGEGNDICNMSLDLVWHKVARDRCLFVGHLGWIFVGKRTSGCVVHGLHGHPRRRSVVGPHERYFVVKLDTVSEPQMTIKLPGKPWQHMRVVRYSPWLKSQKQSMP